MFLVLVLIFFSYYWKNNNLVKIKTGSERKTFGNLVKTIKAKKEKRGKIKKIIITENNDKTLISFTQDKINPNIINILKTNSNDLMNEYLINLCDRHRINYCIGQHVEYNFLFSIINSFYFVINKIIIPCLYIVIMLNIINISTEIINLSSSSNNFNIISEDIIKNKNMSMLNYSSSLANKKIHQDTLLIPNVSLSNWVGSPEIFEECHEIISYQKNKTNYELLGAILPKGVLLEGPPGVGKTYLAKAIATETNSSFITISGSEFIEMYVGVGASRVRELFKMARKKRPSIIFIDEIDAIGGKRSGGSSGDSHREHDQTLNQLLTEMDGFKDNSEIIVLAATNRKDTLDSALLRPGRFDRHIHISLPDKLSREQILNLYLGEKKRKEQKINVSTIADLTDGFSGADLKNLINEAAILAARRGGKMIKSTDLTNAMEKLVVGLERKNDDRSEEARYRVGIHEVGHAFLTIYFKEYFNLQKISIKSTYNGAGGYTLLNEKPEYSNSGLYTKDLLFKKIVILLGGKAAESIWYGGEHVSLGATQDLKQSNQLARKMVEMFGMGSDELETFYNPESNNHYSYNSLHSEKTKELVDKEILLIISNAYQQAKTILSSNKLVCDELVEMLVSQTVLYEKDFKKFYTL
jgi:cell division protease FtsH